MPVVLKVKVGNNFRELCVLKQGKPQTIGRLDHCDHAFPDDIEMSGQHLSISLNPDNSCGFTDLGSTNGTFINEQPAVNGNLRPNDVLRCGLTEFCVLFVAESTSAEPASTAPQQHNSAGAHVHAAVPPKAKIEASRTQPAMSESSAAEVLPQTRGFSGASAREICERYELGKELKPAPADSESPAAYASRLLASCENSECLTFLAYALPKRCAVWWLTQCTLAAKSIKSEADHPMLELAMEWVRKPTEETRRKSMQMAEALEMASPAAWAGLAAFWSHGSMGPPEAPPVLAADNLTGKAVSAGALIASVLQTPENAPERRRMFTELGIKIADGQLPWT